MVCTLLIPYMEWAYCHITALYNYINEVVDIVDTSFSCNMDNISYQYSISYVFIAHHACLMYGFKTTIMSIGLL